MEPLDSFSEALDSFVSEASVERSRVVEQAIEAALVTGNAGVRVFTKFKSDRVVTVAQVDSTVPYGTVWYHDGFLPLSR